MEENESTVWQQSLTPQTHIRPPPHPIQRMCDVFQQHNYPPSADYSTLLYRVGNQTTRVSMARDSLQAPHPTLEGCPLSHVWGTEH